MLDFEKFVITVISFFILYILWMHYSNRNHTYIESDIDGNSYRVQKGKNSKEVANLIAEIVNRSKLLIQHLDKIEPLDERTVLLKTRFNPDNITEGNNDKNVTSYSINKGEQIVLCLRSRDKKRKLVDINTIMFVVIHELGHVCTKSVGHTDEFWDNFKWLLEHAVNIGIYQYEDYDNEPVKYCGISITSTVLDKDNTIT